MGSCHSVRFDYQKDVSFYSTVGNTVSYIEKAQWRSRDSRTKVSDANESSTKETANPLLVNSYAGSLKRFNKASTETKPESYFDEDVSFKMQQQRSAWQDWEDFDTRGCQSLESSDSNQLNTAEVLYLDDEGRMPQLKSVCPRSKIYCSSSSCSSSARLTLTTFIPNPITEVIRGKLYLGCEDNAWDEKELLSLGITHILSVSNHINPIKGIDHKHFVMNDCGRTDLNTVMEKVYPFMERGQETGKKLFVHCKLGQNRSATLVISFLMKNKGLSVYEAYKMLKEMRPLVHIHHNYAKMLLNLERELFGETSLPDDWMEFDEFTMTGTPCYKNEELTWDEQHVFKVNQKLNKLNCFK